jgi:(S)-2-hydroxyglutarate dehydrogenase
MDTDVVVVGAGIVGLAAAKALQDENPGIDVLLLDKEQDIAAHQTGHNSGVVHSGLYYKPGSNKALLARAGRSELIDFCAEHKVNIDMCGKVVVATEASEIARLDELQNKGTANGVSLTRIDKQRLAELEPNTEGIDALHVPDAGIVDFVGMCTAMSGLIIERGGELRLGVTVTGIDETPDKVVVTTDSGGLSCKWLVNCAGLHSDRIAAMANPDHDVRIMPFRGEYYEITGDRASLVNNLIYPVPDPSFPFLGVHLTRMIDGGIHAGPNAVPCLAREGYGWTDVNARDLWEQLSAPSSWKLAKKYWKTGAGEIYRSLNKAAFVKALQRLVPAIKADDLTPSHSGVRAQAIGRDGALFDDFVFADTARTVQIVNAPSPAATASLAIGRTVAARVRPNS